MRLYAFGSNGNGQLGIGSDEDTSTPQSVLNLPSNVSSSSKDAAQRYHHHHHVFAAGGNHTAIITAQDRQLLMTGSNKDCETLLQKPSQEFRALDSSLPHDLLNTRWRSVACGWAFTIAVTETADNNSTARTELPTQSPPKPINHVFAWGSGAFGELGLGKATTKTGPRAIAIQTGALDPSTWNSIDQLEVIKVAAGLRHVLMLVKEKVVRSENAHEQEQEQEQNSSQYLSGQTSRTILLGWGNNRQGQLGVLERPGHQDGKQLPWTEKELRGKFTEPTRLRIHHCADPTTKMQSKRQLPEIVDMACGQHHSLILFSDGTVYASGLNKYSQLGPSFSDLETATATTSTDKEKKARQGFRIGFERIVGLPPVDTISCGWNHNAAMNMKLDPTTIYLWGRDDHGQLGGGLALQMVNAGGKSIPTGIVQVRLGHSSSNSDQNNEQDSSNKEVVSFSCGSEHMLAMTRSGDCYAWGWNEHGNCGDGAEETVDVNMVESEPDLKDVHQPRKVKLPLETLSAVGSDSKSGRVMGGYGSSWAWC
ncbi:hypothetical protein BGW38_000190 [Lunasporangiospora selenospora]|uniref:Uncharacterized protein n=1 Tax=Lunasporangiospora selenospora TaxID=979761 RepID=A0A9P6FW28_9FUNG|nr:hypothetical protein BGW38_000190 [Lunasporangiospora selenospora]